MPVDDGGKSVGTGDIEAQARQVFANLGTAFEAAALTAARPACWGHDADTARPFWKYGDGARSPMAARIGVSARCNLLNAGAVAAMGAMASHI